MPRRILFVERNQDGTVGGSYFSLLELVKKLDRSEFEPVVLFYEDNRLVQEFEKYCEVLVETPLPSFKFRSEFFILDALFLSPVRKALNLAQLYLRLVPQCKALIKTKSIDLVHLNNEYVYEPAWRIAARAFGIPCISHQRSNPKDIQRCSYAQVEKIICISRHIEEMVHRHSPALSDRTVIVHNGIDAEEYLSKVKRDRDEVREELGISSDVFSIAMVSQIRPWKGQHVVVEALRKLREKGCEFVCLFVGSASNEAADQEYLSALKDKIAEYGLSESVVFTGAREDAREIVAASDVFLHAAIEPEPFGRVLLEAMVMRTPLIASADGGPLEILASEEFGFLVSPHDSNSLAETLEQIKDKPTDAKERAARAYKRVTTTFSSTKTAADIQEIYRSLLGGA